MDELMKQLKALADSIAAISGRIDALEKARGSAGDMDALKAEMTKQKDEVTAILAKVQREGITGLDAKGAKRAEAITAFVGAVRGNLSAVTRTSSNEDGGFFVTPEIEAGIMHLAATEGSMRSIADVRGTNSDEVVINVRVKGAAAGHVGENDEREETETPKYAQIRIPIHTQYAEPVISNQALEDPDEDLAAELTFAISEALGVQDEEDFVLGNGVKKARGILSYPTKLCAKKKDLEWGKVPVVKTGKALSFAEANPVQVFRTAKKLLKVAYRTGAVIVTNSDTAAVMEGFVDDNGRPLWVDSIKDGQPDRLIGLGVVINDYMPDIDNAEGLPFAALMNPKKAYAIRDRKGMTMIRDPYTKPGFVKFHTEKRTGAGIKNYEAIVLIKAEA
ncbi:MAG: phage major capsid protein [Spirochaetae bacterium HGW-Spirochaetae-2]|jgi:HK97 family phage major capsid protein|nr:MAG: phage major capsid protein [Spirochaetae bacterium HGW-Spirochaetae-2]